MKKNRSLKILLSLIILVVFGFMAIATSYNEMLESYPISLDCRIDGDDLIIVNLEPSDFEINEVLIDDIYQYADESGDPIFFQLPAKGSVNIPLARIKDEYGISIQAESRERLISVSSAGNGHSRYGFYEGTVVY